MDVRVGSGADDAAAGHPRTGSEYHITLKLVVEDTGELWNLAAQRCIDWTAEEIAETIGPREDPSIEDCLAMVTLPTAIAGCRMVDIALHNFDQGEGQPRSCDCKTEPLPFAVRLDPPHLGSASRLSGDDGASGLVWRS